MLCCVVYMGIKGGVKRTEGGIMVVLVLSGGGVLHHGLMSPSVIYITNRIIFQDSNLYNTPLGVVVLEDDWKLRGRWYRPLLCTWSYWVEVEVVDIFLNGKLSR